MKCSSCGEEMILGYIKCRDGLCFCEKPSQLQSFHLLERTLFRWGKKKSDFSVVERLQLHTDVRNAEKS